jgi:hypothetical protein
MEKKRKDAQGWQAKYGIYLQSLLFKKKSINKEIMLEINVERDSAFIRK